MTTEEWKDALKTPGILLACYFIAPPLLNFALGDLDVLFGRPVLSYLAQAGVGLAILFKLGALKGPLAEALSAWLGRFSQPREKTLELTGAVMFAGGRFAVIALLLSPLAHLLPGPLAVIVTLTAVGYIIYAAHGVWTLYEPFVAKPQEAPEPEAEPEAPAAPERRCLKCGQKLEEGAGVCAFCRHPAV
jgi:hypothetical protein